MDSPSATCSPFKSIEKFNSYPIISDSIYATTKYYYWIKSKHSFLESTLSKAEGAVKSIKDGTESYASKQLHFVDKIVYNQLNRFEKLCPVILEPSSEIISIPSNVYHKAIEPKIQTIFRPVTKTKEIVVEVSGSTMAAVSSVLGCSIKFGTMLRITPSEKTNFILERTEKIVDYYFPEEETNCSENNLSVDPSSYSRVQNISSKTKNGVGKAIANRLKVLTDRCTDILNNIYLMVDIIQKSENPVELLKKNLLDLTTVKFRITQNVACYLDQLFSLEHSNHSDSTVGNEYETRQSLNEILLWMHFVLGIMSGAAYLGSDVTHLSGDILDKSGHVIEYINKKLKVYLQNEYKVSFGGGTKHSSYLIKRLQRD